MGAGLRWCVRSARAFIWGVECDQEIKMSVASFLSRATRPTAHEDTKFVLFLLFGLAAQPTHHTHSHASIPRGTLTGQRRPCCYGARRRRRRRAGAACFFSTRDEGQVTPTFALWQAAACVAPLSWSHARPQRLPALSCTSLLCVVAAALPLGCGRCRSLLAGAGSSRGDVIEKLWQTTPSPPCAHTLSATQKRASTCMA